MEIRETLVEVFRELKIDPTGIEPDSRLREDLEIDSTEMVEIAVALEKRLSISIDTDDFLALKTFGDMMWHVAAAGLPASS
ncbi:acyl carrier protein [Phytohabitans sp. LJ34]|uniref:acyl carrier protein n=1 Tax=Phytohabitans sp. LJ34 TaxID=3452217 RepID=UPI003F8BBEA1